MKYVDLSSVGERFVSEYESVVESLKRLLFSEPDEWVNKVGALTKEAYKQFNSGRHANGDIVTTEDLIK